MTPQHRATLRELQRLYATHTTAFDKEVVDALAALDQQEAQGCEPEVCVCSAWRTKQGGIYLGHRHNNCAQAAWDAKEQPDGGKEAQGFLTTRNRFVGREEGQRLQLEAGVPSAQHDDGRYRGSILTSEDLYRRGWRAKEDAQ